MADATKGIPNPFLKPMDIRRALTTPPPTPDHVLPGLLAGTVGMLAGPGGIGKTMLELQLASALAVGVSPLRGALDGWCEGRFVNSPQRVVLVTAEEPEDVLRERLHAVVGELLASGVPGLEADRVLAMLEQNLVVFPFTGGPRVASEVRALAQRSATAANEIKGIIQHSVEKMANGTVLAEKAGGAVGTVVEAIQKANTTVTEVATATREQAEGINQIGQAVMQLDEATQQNAALVEETAAATTNLDDQVQALKGQLARFKI